MKKKGSVYQLKFDTASHPMRGLHDDDIMCRRWAKTGTFYELDLLRHLSSYGRRGLYIDAGANLGNHSVFFLAHSRAEELWSVEGHPAIRSVLLENLERNSSRLNWMAPHCYLAAEPDQKAEPGEIVSHNVGSTRMGPLSEEGVTVTTLDRLCGARVDVGVIKVDCEGMDYDILTGGLSVLKRCRPVVAAEAEGDYDRERLDALLAPLGYTRQFETKKRPASYVWAP